jgi:nitrile hydratase accessory protein
VTEAIAPEVRDMPAPSALPRQNGELVFAAPWEGRALGMAVSLTESLGVEWDVFRQELIKAIEAAPDRAYYESWLIALERLVVSEGVCSADEIGRRSGVPLVRDEPGVGRVEVFDVSTDTESLLVLLRDLFENWWQQIRFGPIIQGAVYELRAPGPPRSMKVLDGYLTVDFASWHLHLCIGDHRGAPGSEVEPEVARRRRCQRAELYRLMHDEGPVSWGLRMFNGDDEQMITVLLPNPFLDDDQVELSTPDWHRLKCWDDLRERFLGLPPDARDRTATRFRHG